MAQGQAFSQAHHGGKQQPQQGRHHQRRPDGQRVAVVGTGQQARAQTGSAEAYASALQKAGYATDPAYARKLSGAIQSALRVQRDQA